MLIKDGKNAPKDYGEMDICIISFVDEIMKSQHGEALTEEVDAQANLQNDLSRKVILINH